MWCSATPEAESRPATAASRRPGARSPGRTVHGDVADAATAKLLLDAATELGGLEAWVNNAGVSVLAPIIDTSPADLSRMLDVNVTGTLHGMQAAAGAFLEAGRGGRIVNIASDLGVQACANLGAYAASKFAVVGLTQAAAIELAAAGITVNAVCPGTAETDMVLAERASEVRLSGCTDAEVRNAYLQAIPAGRFCTPEDVGALVSWLCTLRRVRNRPIHLHQRRIRPALRGTPHAHTHFDEMGGRRRHRRARHHRLRRQEQRQERRRRQGE